MRNDVQRWRARSSASARDRCRRSTPATGRSWPCGRSSYDPNALATHDFTPRSRLDLLNADPRSPILALVPGQLLPGSDLRHRRRGRERGGVTEDQPDYPARQAYQPVGAGGRPVWAPIGNFGGATCGGTLFPIMEASCNSAFAEMGAEDAGADAMIDTAQAFGFNQDVPIDLPRPALVVPDRVRERPPKSRSRPSVRTTCGPRPADGAGGGGGRQRRRGHDAPRGARGARRPGRGGRHDRHRRRGPGRWTAGPRTCCARG